MPEFPLLTMDRFLRNAGSERVSKGARLELSAVLESIGKELAEEAVRRAKHRGVKTVDRKDIRSAVRTKERYQLR